MKASEGRAWTAQLPLEHARGAWRLRSRRDVEVCETDGALWLRGPRLDDETLLELRKLPLAAVHEIGEGGTIHRLGRRLPEGRLPPGPWSRIDRWIRVALPVAALAGAAAAVRGKVKLALVRSASEREASVLLTDVRAWARWASAAALVRLGPLRFAASSDGRVAVQGTPLPPLGGQRFTETDGVAVPCGLAWFPLVGGSVLRELLRLQKGDVALFESGGAYELIEASAFVHASRAAARRTLEGYEHA